MGAWLRAIQTVRGLIWPFLWHSRGPPLVSERRGSSVSSSAACPKLAAPAVARDGTIIARRVGEFNKPFPLHHKNQAQLVRREGQKVLSEGGYASSQV